MKWAKNTKYKLAYDREADVLYLSVGEPRPAISRQVGDEVLSQIDPDTGAVIGLTVLNLATRSLGEILPNTVALHSTGID